MQLYFNKIFFKIFNYEKLNILKNFLINNVNWKMLKKSLKSLVLINITELKEFLQLKNRWKKNQKFFKNWVWNQIINLNFQWIQNKELKMLGFIEIINAYKHLINIIEKTKLTTHIQKIKYEEVKYLKTNSNLNKIYLDQTLFYQFQKWIPKLYAPIKKLKNKMKIWKMLSKNGIPKACSRFLIFYCIIFIFINILFFLILI